MDSKITEKINRRSAEFTRSLITHPTEQEYIIIKRVMTLGANIALDQVLEDMKSTRSGVQVVV